MSLTDELTLLDKIRAGLVESRAKADERSLLEKQESDTVVIECLSIELLDVFAHLQELERRISHESQGVAQHTRGEEDPKDVALKKVLLEHRNEIAILCHQREVISHLFWGTLKEQFPKYATGEWYVRKGFMVVVVPNWDPETGDPIHRPNRFGK